MKIKNLKLNFFLFLLLFVSGCGSVVSESTNYPVIPTPSPVQVVESIPSVPTSVSESLVVLPVDGNAVGYNATYKRFGEYFEDRFSGYHAGEDIEVPPEDLGPGEIQKVPVRAIANGTVKYLKWVSGYGGVMVIEHEVGDEVVNAIYGHIDIDSTSLKVGDRVIKSQFLANLGADKSKQTDGERQHLHFALYAGETLRINGYEKNVSNLKNWINPQDFFRDHGVVLDSSGFVSSDALTEPSGRKFFPLSFDLRSDWDIEYIPSLKAWNVYTIFGSGSARDRSQIFIRYFDADKFLTLNTVDIFSMKESMVGQSYEAKQYDIQKKSHVPNFSDQPLWRNERHTVTDFRDKQGFTRYFVVAKNPNLDDAAYQKFLESIVAQK